jgi:putative oxidoreductase
MFQKVMRFLGWATGMAEKANWLGPLLIRVTVGVMFARSGWGKIHNIESTATWFGELGLPAPLVQAYLASFTELVGGTAIVLGFGARLFAVPLAFTMVVAMATGGAFGDEPPTGIVDVLAKEESAYFAAMVWIALAGAGKFSIDALLKRKLVR